MVKGTVTTVTLTANTPKAIRFSEAYPYYWIDNKSNGNVYVSTSGNPEADTDGTYTVAAGAQLRISGGPYDSDIVLLGEGKVQVIASGIAESPFKVAPVKNGGGGANAEFQRNFSGENIMEQLAYASQFTRGVSAEGKFTLTVQGNLSPAWYLIASYIPIKVGTMYKLRIKGYTGYGRLAISSCGNGGYIPYDQSYFAVVGNFSDYMNLFDFQNGVVPTGEEKTIYFYVVPPKNNTAEKINCGLFLCADINQSDTSEFTFEMTLEESIEY